MSDQYRIRYGEHFAKPKGEAPDYALCCAEVWRDCVPKQCSHKRGHGPDEAYCKQCAKGLEDDDELQEFKTIGRVRVKTSSIKPLSSPDLEDEDE